MRGIRLQNDLWRLLVQYQIFYKQFKKYHGFNCLRRIIYMTTTQLGYSIGPLDVKTAKMLIDKGLIVTNNINPTYKSPILAQ